MILGGQARIRLMASRSTDSDNGELSENGGSGRRGPSGDERVLRLAEQALSGDESALRALRVRRPKREREAPDMAAMVERIARAMVRRAASGDLDALAALRAMREAVDVATKEAAQELHTPTKWIGEGYSWTVIGDHLGISRQAARQAYQRKS